MITEAELTSFIAAVFSMMNPIGNLGVFAGLTAEYTGARARRTAWACAVAVAVTLLIVTWTGSMVMSFFGLSVEALRTAGGIIVLIIGLHMLFNKSGHKHTPSELQDGKASDSIAVVPMAIPIVAGPGTMVTVLVAAEHSTSAAGRAEISVVVVVMSALTGLLFSFAAPLAKWLGAAGMGVVTRVMGMILASIAVGMLAEGMKALLPGLAGPAG